MSSLVIEIGLTNGRAGSRIRMEHLIPEHEKVRVQGWNRPVTQHIVHCLLIGIRYSRNSTIHNERDLAEKARYIIGGLHGWGKSLFHFSQQQKEDGIQSGKSHFRTFVSRSKGQTVIFHEAICTELAYCERSILADRRSYTETRG